MAKDADKKNSKNIFEVGIQFFLVCLGVLVWNLFLLITKHIPTKIARIKGKCLQLPVVTYEHLHTKRRVIFLAVMHAADAGYYAALEQLIQKYPTYQVLYEMIGPLLAGEREKLSRDEKAILEKFEEGRKLFAVVQELLDITSQHRGISLQDSWIRTDISMYELVHALAVVEVPRNRRSLKKMADQKIMRWFFDYMFSNFASVLLLLRLAIPFLKIQGQRRVILDQRNEIGVAAILKHSKESNVITIWGAEHLIGMDKMLRKAGYRQIQRSWIDAYRSRGYRFFSILKDIKKSDE